MNRLVRIVGVVGVASWQLVGFFRRCWNFSLIFRRECSSGVERGFFSKLVQTAQLWYGGGGEHYTLLHPSTLPSVLRFADPCFPSPKSVLEATSRLATRPRRSLWHSLSSARTRSGRTGIAFHLPHRDGKNISNYDVHKRLILC